MHHKKTQTTAKFHRKEINVSEPTLLCVNKFIYFCQHANFQLTNLFSIYSGLYV